MQQSEAEGPSNAGITAVVIISGRLMHVNEVPYGDVTSAQCGLCGVGWGDSSPASI